MGPDLGRDHILVVQAARARASEQPMYARTLVDECTDPMGAALDLLAVLLKERAEKLGAP